VNDETTKLTATVSVNVHHDVYQVPSHVLADLRCAVAAVPNVAASGSAVLPAAATFPSSHAAETTH